ncbi:MAG: trypsin-like peptidase domain-containing protein [Lachnospiraceae bacterium]|nr:trypsin-like peptidase domain-containing protein [Lachnospiraceae bacterium]
MSDMYDDDREKRESEGSEPITYSWVSPKLRSDQNTDGTEQQSSQNNMDTDESKIWRAETQENASATQGNTSYAGQSTSYSWRNADTGSIPNEPEQKNRKRSGNRRNGSPSGKKHSSGKKWGATVAMAVVFGLVAGTVFTGVSAVGNKIVTDTSEEQAEIPTTGQTTIETTESAAAETQTTSVSTASAGTVADVAAQAMPSLVTISTISVEEMQSFFGQTQQYEVSGAGTGVIVGQNDTELLIATNNHVISGAKSLSVGFIDETAVEGAVKGTDEDTDLAVVAVKLEDIPEETMNQIRICEMGNSDDLVLGEQVVAIGNALGYGQSVTSGYISAFDRELTLSDGSYTFTSSGLIQTDASINSGNSGGALLNMQGQLVGINEAKSSGSSSSASVDNIGFAIPIAKAEPILEDLMTLTTRASVSEENASYIGITCADVSEETAQMYNMPEGVCLTSIMENSPAEAAGLKKGDILTSFDGREVSTYSKLVEILQYYAAGETVDVTVYRSNDGEYNELTISLTLGAASDMPENYQSGNSSQESQNDESQQSEENSQGRGWTFP